jgi:ssDNA-binding Zn-finger/Zn-ribbon topoisomerase 1
MTKPTDDEDGVSELEQGEGAEDNGIVPGKRYECAQCGGQLICTKGGEGSLACCGEPMTKAEAKALPSAD